MPSESYVVGNTDTPGRAEKTHAFEFDPDLPQKEISSVQFEGAFVALRPICDKKKRKLSVVLGALGPDNQPTCGVCKFTLENRLKKVVK